MTYFRFGSAHQSRSIQQLFLQLMDDGSFDDKSQDSSLSWCRRLDNAGDEAPLFVIEALTHWLDRSIGATVASGSTPFERHNYDQSGTRLISTVARCEPLAYAEQILPRVVAAVMRFPATSHGGLKRNATWPYPSQADPATVVDAVLAELRNALEHIARTQPDEFNRLTNDLRDTNYETLANLLLSAWAANPTRFGDVCIRFMAAEPRRLDVGYASWSGRGDGSAAISRTAIRACVPHASAECRSELEQTVVDFLPFGEDGDFAGATEHLLLEAMGEDHLSERGRSRLTTLRAKFPDRDVTIPPRRAGPAKVTGSPIPPNVTREFTDEQWLAAMKQYDYGREFNPKRELTGSAVELSRLLQLEARLNRPRFAALVARMDDSIRPEYFEAILDGLCGLDNLSKEERATDDEDFERLDPEVVFGVLRRLHQLPHHPCGRCICRAFERLASRPFSDADLEILAHYALDDPDPASEHWLEHNSAAEDDRVQNAHFSGYNSVRGLAARAISAILFSDYSYSTHLLPVLQKMVCDPLMSVRTCVAEALLPLLNHDRDEAVRLFLDNCRGADVVFGCYTFEEFIRYATSTHYAQLRDVLLTELNSRTPSSMRAAARQTCLAAFVDDAAEADANLVRTGPDALRRAAAEVYAYNLADATIGPVCREHLARLFSDPSEDVRNEAADCFRHLENADFNEFADFIRSYIESPAFPSQHDDLLRRLEDSTWQLPDITLRLAERFIASCGASAGDISTAAAGDATPVSKLVIRLYVQSGDEGIRTRCLDLIDAMERFGFYGIDSQLAEHDR